MRKWSHPYHENIGIALTALLIIGIFAYVLLGIMLPWIEESLYAQRYELVKRMIELAMSDLNSRNEDVLDGRISLEEAQKRSFERYKKIRYGEEEKDYYWIVDGTPVLRMHPYRPDLEGEIIGEIPDLKLKEILAEMVRIADSPEGEGFLEYDWQFKDDRTLIKPKISYVKYFEPWDWIIGTGAYIDDIKGDLADIRARFLIIVLTVLLLTSLGIGVLTLFAFSSRKKKEKSERDIRSSEQRFKKLFNLLPFSCVINSFDGRIMEANDYHCKVTGLSREEIRGRTAEDLNRFISPEDKKVLMEELGNVGYVAAREVRVNMGEEESWLLISSSLIDWHDESAILTTTINITDRKRADRDLARTAERMYAQREALAALAESEAMASGIAERAVPEIARLAAEALNVERVGTWVFREETHEIVNVDQYVASRDEHFSGDSLCLDNYPSYWESIRYETRVDAHDAVADERLSELREDWIIPQGITSLMDAGIMQEGRFAGLFSCEHTGPRRHWHADEQAFVSSLAALVGQIFATDERRRAEASLRASEESLRATLKSMGEGVIVTDPDGSVTLMNQKAEEITGWTLREMRGKSLSAVIPVVNRETREEMPDLVREVVSSGTVVRHPDHSVLIAKDGTEFLIADSGAPVFSESGAATGVVIVFRNITREKELQEQFNQMQKMESIGQLAGGVAHDFNNMLGGIIGAAELLENASGLGEDARSYVALILESAERAASLTRKLLTFARKQPASASDIDILHPLRDAVSFVESTADKRIKIHAGLPEGELTVKGNRSELQNAFMNILINATHAMPEGGDIFVSARIGNPDSEDLERMGMDMEPGPCAEVEIRDTGWGIPRKDLKRIFEPFYTTKEQGKGTGLGLSSVFGTVQQYGGAVRVRSEVGAGTSFHIYIPLSEGGGHGEGASRERIVKGRGTVLLVDDEKVVRKTAGRLLEELGYHVLYAGNGRAAAELFAEKAGQIDLVILDMVMPEVNGRDCFFALKGMDPSVRIILSSGFYREEEIEPLREAGLDGIVNKPFRKSELSRIVSEALKRPSDRDSD